MPSNPWRFFLPLAVFLLCFKIDVAASIAEPAYSASISIPDTSDFPRLTMFLDVHDPSGAFVHELSPQDVVVEENNSQVPARQVDELKPGVQFVLAITPGDPFFIRDNEAISRYEYLHQALLSGTWVDQSPGVDDYSLLTAGGPQITHSPDPSALKSALEEYLPTGSKSAPDLEVLASALQVAGDPTPRPGMERAILFITPPQPGEVSLGLESIISSATRQDIRISVWLIASQQIFDQPDVDLLRNLAEQTHGSFFAFSHDETIPDLESLLDPLRYVYRIGYDSQVITAGLQQVAVQVTAGDQAIISDSRSFELDIRPPAAYFSGLPAEIKRNFPEQATMEAEAVGADLMPQQQLVRLRVSFPDGHQRPIARASLFVDGVLVAQNTAAPFDQFTWDIAAYMQDGDHTLTAEVVDDLGLVGKTGKASVRIVVPTTTQNVLAVFSQKRPFVAGVVILISASILVLVLIVSGRIRPKPHPGQVIPVAGGGEKTRPVGYHHPARTQKNLFMKDEKVKSPPAAQSKPRLMWWKVHLPWVNRKVEQVTALAYIVPLIGPDEITIPEPRQIFGSDVTLGSDPQRADITIADPSIEGVHARLHQEGETFLLSDLGSVAGTYVNYRQAVPPGTPLEHADIIHLGRIGFRFNLSNPGQPHKIVVTPLEPEA